MDIKKYSLSDIFGFLRESTLLLSKSVVVPYEKDGKQESQVMLLSEYIAMAMAHELISDNSRMASESTTSTKDDVITAMKENYYDKVAFPNYEYFGIRMSSV